MTQFLVLAVYGCIAIASMALLIYSGTKFKSDSSNRTAGIFSAFAGGVVFVIFTYFSFNEGVGRIRETAVPPHIAVQEGKIYQTRERIGVSTSSLSSTQSIIVVREARTQNYRAFRARATDTYPDTFTVIDGDIVAVDMPDEQHVAFGN